MDQSEIDALMKNAPAKPVKGKKEAPAETPAPAPVPAPAPAPVLQAAAPQPDNGIAQLRAEYAAEQTRLAEKPQRTRGIEHRIHRRAARFTMLADVIAERTQPLHEQFHLRGFAAAFRALECDEQTFGHL